MVYDIFAEAGHAASISGWADLGLVVIGIIGVIGVIGAVSAYFYKGRADALIKLLQEENEVLKGQKERLEQQNKQLIEERRKFLEEQKEMRRDLKTLKGLYSPQQLNELAKTLTTQHQEVVSQLADIAKGLVEHGTN